MTPYYEDDFATIYHGDCREVLPSISSVDAVITDPPYSDHTHGKERMGSGIPDPHASGQRRVAELGFDALTPDLMHVCADHFARLARRWVLVFSDAEMSGDWRTALTSSGLDYVRTGAWVKLNPTPQFSGDRPASGFEAVTIAHRKGRKRWNGGGLPAVWQVPVVINRGGKSPRLHTTQKPVPLMQQLISLFTDEGETVLDPFMGSGTTLRAARDIGRKAIGIEVDEHYCQVAAERLGASPSFADDSLFGGVA